MGLAFDVLWSGEVSIGYGQSQSQGQGRTGGSVWRPDYASRKRWTSPQWQSQYPQYPQYAQSATQYWPSPRASFNRPWQYPQYPQYSQQSQAPRFSPRYGYDQYAPEPTQYRDGGQSFCSLIWFPPALTL
jgi:hypothetical protein